jgi:hypothetical protein
MGEEKELVRLARAVLGESDVPSWVETDFVSSLPRFKGMKAYGGRLGNTSSWLLQGEGKLYKDRFGWISWSWHISPHLIGSKWGLRSEMSFAPATNSSAVREKFDEFTEEVKISGAKESKMFFVEGRSLTKVMPIDADKSDVERFMSIHEKELKAASRWWKMAKKEIGIV